MLSVAEAQSRVLQAHHVLAAERVPIQQAANRVLAVPLSARVSSPPSDVSAMDGYAVQASSSATFRVAGVSAAGAGYKGVVSPGECVRIFTGAPLPAGTDTVIIQENVQRDGNDIRVLPEMAAHRGRHVRRTGLDFNIGDTLIEAGTRLGSRELALAAAMNCAELECTRRPRVGILATGDELVEPGDTPSDHQIVSSTPYGLVADVASWGGDAVYLGIAKDNLKAIRDRLTNAQDFDVLVTIGGASVGDYDLVQAALAPDLDVAFWKIAMRPGKPLIFGRYKGVSLLGLPGNPVSAFVCSLMFLKPTLFKLLGCREAAHRYFDAKLSVALEANDGRQDFCRATIVMAGDGTMLASPLPVQDSSMLRYLNAAKGFIVRAPQDPPKAVGDTVSVLLLS